MLIARSVRRSPARMHIDACATRQLHCQWCSGRPYATLAAHTVSVRQCRAPATGTLAVGRRSRIQILYWTGLFAGQRSGGMNACVYTGVACSRSRTVSRAVENITQFCWKYSSSIQQWKNFKNRLRFEKVIAKSLVASFWGDTVYMYTMPLDGRH